MKGFSYINGVVTVSLDRNTCTGCGICTSVCPHDLFVIEAGKASITDRDICIECGACALNCPVKALSVDAGVGCASGMINEWLDSFNLRGRSGGGCC